MKEAYCSYEIAKLLKEKGFDEPCIAVYEEKVLRINTLCDYHNSELSSYICAPTHQMACAWLREMHQLHISVNAYPIYGRVKDEKGKNTCGLLYWNYIANGEWMNDKYNPQQKAFVVAEKSHERVIEAALKYSLENLI